MVFAAFTAASCLHGTTLYKRTLAKRAQIKPFGYTNRLSAINWANLDPDYSACALGMDKSSINLDNSTAFATEISQIDIPIAQTVSLLNIGTTLEVVFVNGSGGTTTFQNQTFNLIQCHFHTPSEHRFNEEFFPAEMHMVQENIDDPTSFFVLTAVFQLTEGVGLPFIDAILLGLENVTTPGTNTTIGPFDLLPAIAALTASSLTNYVYSGSLTTPPCTEGVMFLIPAEQIPITVAQFNAMKQVMKFNSRYTQNELGEVNLLRVASGNDSAVAETADELAALGETEEFPLEYV